MPRSKLVCNLGLDDFFMLPDSSEVWRKKSSDHIFVVDASGDNVKRFKAYRCVSLYDNSQEVTLPANQRVDLLDN